MEKAPKAERWSKEEVMRTIKVLVGAFLVLLPTGVESADFRNKSWLGGMRQMKYLTQKEGAPEFKALAIGKTGTTKFGWVNLYKGEQAGINFDTLGGQQTMQADKKEYQKAQYKWDSLTACIAHTHPNKGDFFFAPVAADVNFHITYQKQVALESTVPVEVTGLVFSHLGAWYYDVPEDGVEQIDDNHGDPGLTMNDFHRRLNGVVHDPNSSDEQIWKAIHDLEAVFAHNGVKLRFVHYKDMLSEPACAGPYFDPGKMTTQKNF